MRSLSSLSSLVSLAALRALVWFQTVCYARRPAQGLVEYGLILVLIMVVCVAILTTVGRTVSNVWYQKLIPAF
jgi:predicted membrane protein